MTFCIQNMNPASRDATDLTVVGGAFFIGGGTSGGFGYMQPPNGAANGIAGFGLPTSFAISFNGQTSAMGVYPAGAEPSGSDVSVTGITFQSGHPLLITVVYNGTTLVVTVKDTVTSTTFNHTFSGPYNIASVVGGTTATVGFTAGGPLDLNSFETNSVNTWTM